MATGNTRNLPASFATPIPCADGAGGLGPGLVFDRPLPHVPEHYTVRRRYQVDARYYARGNPAMGGVPYDSPDPVYPDAFLVDEQPERQFDNLLFFYRLYATIPATWVTPGSAVVTVPGMFQTPTLAASISATGFSGGPWANSGVQVLTTSAAHGLSIGTRVSVNISFTLRDFSRGANQAFTIHGDYNVAGGSGTDLHLPLGPLSVYGQPADAVISFSGAVIPYTAGYPIRRPKTRNLPVFVERTYYLPGVSPGVSSIADIVFPQIFSIDIASVADPDFPDNTVGEFTVPTAAQYWASVAAGAGLVLEAPLEIYLGNIVAVRKATWIAQ